MKATVTAVVFCIVLASCQAAVRRATTCTLANECMGTCEDTTHHWSCINHACECHTHGVTTAPSNRPHIGSACKVKDDCNNMHNCYSSFEHCYDGACKCSSLSENGEHHHG